MLIRFGELGVFKSNWKIYNHACLYAVSQCYKTSMQYIKAAQVLLTMWRFHIQSMERSIRTDGIYTLKRRKAEVSILHFS